MTGQVAPYIETQTQVERKVSQTIKGVMLALQSVSPEHCEANRAVLWSSHVKREGGSEDARLMSVVPGAISIYISELYLRVQDEG